MAIQCAARCMTCLWVTEQLYLTNINPPPFLPNKNWRYLLAPLQSTVYGNLTCVAGNRLADDVRDSASMGPFRQNGLQASAGGPVLLLRVLVVVSDFRRPRRAMNILRIIGLRQHFDPGTPPKRTKIVTSCITIFVMLGCAVLVRKSICEVKTR